MVKDMKIKHSVSSHQKYGRSFFSKKLCGGGRGGGGGGVTWGLTSDRARTE